MDRFSLGFYSPNYAGCVFALVATVLQWLNLRRRRESALLSTGEIVAVLLLAFTQSRSAAVAAVMALLLTLCVRWRRGDDLKKLLKALGERVFTYGILFVLAGTTARMRPSFMAGDLSVANRLEYWKAGLEALFRLPFGPRWPAGSDVELYHNWVEGSGQLREIPGFHCMFLSVGVDLGAWAAIGLVAIVSAAVISPFVGPRPKPFVELISVSGVCLGLCNSVSTLSGDWFVSAIEALWLAAALASLARERKWGMAATALIIAAASFTVAKWYWCQRSPSDVLASTGCLGVKGHGTSETSPPILLFSTDGTFGRFPGKLVRALAEKSGRTTYLLLDSGQHSNLLQCLRNIGAGTVVLGGTQPDELRRITNVEVVLLHPLGKEREDMQRSIRTIILPEIDEFGENKTWLAQQRSNGWKIEFAGLGQFCVLRDLQRIGGALAK